VLAGIASGLVLVLTGMSGVGAAVYRDLESNVATNELSSVLGGASQEPANFEAGKPLNIVLMGSDSRAGANEEYGDATVIEGARSDTTLLLHISADRKSALVVSIPRDTVVDIPSCPRFVGGPSEPTRDRFNEAFWQAGPVCTVKTIEKMAGIYVDHFVVVDFSGFKGVVDAIDGVEVCLKEPVDDPLSGLKLPAGTQTIKGEDALAFVRARYTLGDGSDIGRIDRQQAFLASAIRKMTSLGVLGNPITAYRILDQVTSSLTTSKSLDSLNGLTDFALSLSDMSPEDITFVTLPHYYNEDGATVSPDPVLAAALWKSVREDATWPPSPTVPPGQSTPLTVSPDAIRVRVLNGTGKDGAAAKAAEQLITMGYQVVETGDFDLSMFSKTAVQYPPGYAEAARTLAYATQTQAVGEDTSGVGGDVLTLVVGEDFTRVLPVVAQAPTTPTPPTTDPNTGEVVAPSRPTTEDVKGTSANTTRCF
jgi:LCP family protein required for cell wall assembly